MESQLSFGLNSTPHPALSGSLCAAPHPSFGHLLPTAEKGISPFEAERVVRRRTGRAGRRISSPSSRRCEGVSAIIANDIRAIAALLYHPPCARSIPFRWGERPDRNTVDLLPARLFVFYDEFIPSTRTKAVQPKRISTKLNPTDGTGPDINYSYGKRRGGGRESTHGSFKKCCGRSCRRERAPSESCAEWPR